jgi:acyl carrier protein
MPYHPRPALPSAIPREQSIEGSHAEPDPTVEAGVRDVIVAHLGIEPERVRLESWFHDLDADSLDVIEILLGLEGQFDLALSTVPPRSLHTVADAVRLVTQRLRLVT